MAAKHESVSSESPGSSGSKPPRQAGGENSGDDLTRRRPRRTGLIRVVGAISQTTVTTMVKSRANDQGVALGTRRRMPPAWLPAGVREVHNRTILIVRLLSSAGL